MTFKDGLNWLRERLTPGIKDNTRRPDGGTSFYRPTQPGTAGETTVAREMAREYAANQPQVPYAHTGFTGMNPPAGGAGEMGSWDPNLDATGPVNMNDPSHLTPRCVYPQPSLKISTFTSLSPLSFFPEVMAMPLSLPLKEYFTLDFLPEKMRNSSTLSSFPGRLESAL